MDHLHGTLTYNGNVGEDLMGKVMGPGRDGKFLVCTNTEYIALVDKTRAEFDELTVGNHPGVVWQ